jgi:hypothetical protein
LEYFFPEVLYVHPRMKCVTYLVYVCESCRFLRFSFWSFITTSGGLSSQDGVPHVSNGTLTVIPLQSRLTQQILIHWQPFRDLKLTFPDSCRTEQLRLHCLRKRIPPRVSSPLNRWVGWVRSGLTVEMKSGLLVSVRLSLSWPWSPRSRSLLRIPYRFVVAGKQHIQWKHITWLKTGGRHCGDIEHTSYLTNTVGPVPLVMDLQWYR